jgi:hypothetical protein
MAAALASLEAELELDPETELPDWTPEHPESRERPPLEAIRQQESADHLWNPEESHRSYRSKDPIKILLDLIKTNLMRFHLDILQVLISFGIPISQTDGLSTPTDLPGKDSDLLLEVTDRVVLTLHRLPKILDILFIGLKPIAINVHHVVMEPTEVGLDPVHLSGQLVDTAVVIAPKFAMTTSLRAKSLHDRRQIFVILQLRSHR